MWSHWGGEGLLRVYRAHIVKLVNFCQSDGNEMWHLVVLIEFPLFTLKIPKFYLFNIKLSHITTTNFCVKPHNHVGFIHHLFHVP